MWRAHFVSNAGSDLFQRGLLQLRVGQQPLETGVLALQILQAFRVVGLESTELVTPPVVGLLRDLQLPAHAQHPIGLRELAHDLLRRVPLPRCHVLVEPSCPRRGRQDSHSTWINQPGSGH
jgi:hypothetical protein